MIFNLITLASVKILRVVSTSTAPRPQLVPIKIKQTDTNKKRTPK